jgi:F0F1-type ATP synthase membrane subunit a
MLDHIIQKFRSIEPKRILIYVLVYFLWGLLMNWIGQQLEIAKFTYWWQVITTYLLYMIPISILLRGYTFFTQYAYGLVAMGLLEFGGYALRTSYIYPDNILEQWFGPHTFALGMALFFALYFPVGNYVVNRVYLRFIDKNRKI